MRKRFLAVMMAAAMAVTMVGCGKADNSSAAGTSKNNTASTSKDNKKDSKAENLNATVSSIINNGEYSIWYESKDIDKDYEAAVYVLYNDGSYIATNSYEGSTYYTFKELAGMTDDEILSYVEDSWKAYNESKDEVDLEEEMSKTASKLGFGGYGDYYITGDSEKLNSYVEDVYRMLLEFAVDYVYDMDDDARTADIDYESMMHQYGFGDFWIDWIQEHYDSYVADFYGMMIDEEEPDCSELEASYLAAASAACDDALAEVKAGFTGSYDKGSYTITVWTDSTGNNVKQEDIVFSDGSSWVFKSYAYPRAILDVYYGGYNNGSRVCVIRTSAETSFAFDALGTEGVNVDEHVEPWKDAN